MDFVGILDEYLRISRLKIPHGEMKLKLGIIGLPGSGKSTVFRALTGGLEGSESRKHRDADLGVVRVSDPRLDFLADFHKPRKVTPVTVEYSDIQGVVGEDLRGKTSTLDKFMSLIRPLDALVHCVRFFDSPALGEANPLGDFRALEDEMILSDMAIVERRLERVRKDLQKGKRELALENELLTKALDQLEQGKPLRCLEQTVDTDKLRGFSFLSSKPELVLVNAEEDKSGEQIRSVLNELETLVNDQPRISVDWLFADTEAEITGLSVEEAREFLEDLSLNEGAKDRIVRTSFLLLELIVFFTAGEPEVRAWPLTSGSSALEAAGTVHTDMAKGFIRAEIVSFDDFRDAGSMAAAHKAGKIRLEGKDYTVRDGDIILFRFNV